MVEIQAKRHAGRFREFVRGARFAVEPAELATEYPWEATIWGCEDPCGEAQRGIESVADALQAPIFERYALPAAGIQT